MAISERKGMRGREETVREKGAGELVGIHQFGVEEVPSANRAAMGERMEGSSGDVWGDTDKGVSEGRRTMHYPLQPPPRASHPAPSFLALKSTLSPNRPDCPDL